MNNMVNIYNISINYKLIPLQNDPWVRKKIAESSAESKRGWSLHKHN
jgi:hypothetical protein